MGAAMLRRVDNMELKSVLGATVCHSLTSLMPDRDNKNNKGP